MATVALTVIALAMIALAACCISSSDSDRRGIGLVIAYLSLIPAALILMTL